jgi:CubicO group peptidase (beta-lactamase class C family)
MNVKHWHRFFKSMAVCLALAVLPACTVSEDNQQAGDLGEQIRGLIRPHVRVGAMVGVIHRGGRLVYSFGRKSLETEDMPNSGTVFEIGSITKTFTGILLADMEIRGFVDADDPAGAYLPAHLVVLPMHSGIEITLKHLAAHLSGLPRRPPGMAPPEEYPYLTYTVQDMYDFLNGYTLIRAPGAEYQYSSIGMGLLGHTLGVVDGSSYEELLHRRIFDILGMTRSSVFLTTAQESNLAVGHDSQLAVTRSWDAHDCLQGAGTIKSCLNDLFLYLEANMGLRTSPLAAPMSLSHQSVFSISSDERIGLGWGLYDMPGQEILWHNGLTAGYTSYMGFNKTLGNGVIILFNHFDAPSWEVGEPILSLLRNQ